MTFTLNDMVNSVAGVLKERWPDVKVYNNPNQGGATLPCFFVFFMPTEMYDEMDRRSRREIGIDVVYLVKKNIPDAFDQLTEVAECLDECFDSIKYKQDGETAFIRTFEREWKIDEGKLHYQFVIKPIVSQPDSTPAIETMDYKGGIKRAEDNERKQFQVTDGPRRNKV